MGEEKSVRRIVPWHRLGIEVVTIVLSILLALAVDAWWDRRNDLAREREHLEVLRAEFASADRLISAQIAQLHEARGAARQLLSLDPEQANQARSEHLADLFFRVMSPGRANLPSGSLDALVASGDLSLIENRELAARIAAWPSFVAEAWENATWLVEQRERELAPFLRNYVGGLWTAGRTGLLEGFPETRFPPRVSEMFSDPRLEGNLANAAVRLGVMLVRYDVLAAKLDTIQGLIDQELGG